MRTYGMQLPCGKGPQILQSLLREHVQSTIRHLQVRACGVCRWRNCGYGGIAPSRKHHDLSRYAPVVCPRPERQTGPVSVFPRIRTFADCRHGGDSRGDVEHHHWGSTRVAKLPECSENARLRGNHPSWPGLVNAWGSFAQASRLTMLRRLH